MFRNYFFGCLAVLVFSESYAQTATDSIVVDDRYRDDQFYLGVVYNYLIEGPTGTNQSNFSYGLMGGFVRDMPINKRRNVSFGLGFGYAIDQQFSNIRAQETKSGVSYDVIPSNEDFNRNKLRLHRIEFPLEFRWRTSTATDYSFWRIYAGFKFGYIVDAKSTFENNDVQLNFKNEDLRKWQYGLSLSMGYDSFNLYFYYPLTQLYKDGVQLDDGQEIGLKDVRIGLLFHIL
ncbi:porin family protein [Sediminicola luteus]|uniref:Outer membrane protein beta-barrel domain-containing protein n=1 Tax=Sediminicola luteus TaxID=319238 RepID=A0A2A4G627_9FLAO|nr:porin family protein [Sediminicola luteus]PCE63192.1 hypothetical protein B7P33_13255 [Sediminicola luteus]